MTHHELTEFMYKFFNTSTHILYKPLYKEIATPLQESETEVAKFHDQESVTGSAQIMGIG